MQNSKKPIKQKTLERMFTNQEEAEKIPYFSTESLNEKYKGDSLKASIELNSNETFNTYKRIDQSLCPAFQTNDLTRGVDGIQYVPQTDRGRGFNQVSAVRLNNGQKTSNLYPGNRVRLDKFKKHATNKYIISETPNYDRNPLVTSDTNLERKYNNHKKWLIKNKPPEHTKRAAFYQMAFEQRANVNFSAVGYKEDHNDSDDLITDKNHAGNQRSRVSTDFIPTNGSISFTSDGKKYIATCTRYYPLGGLEHKLYKPNTNDCVTFSVKMIEYKDEKGKVIHKFYQLVAGADTPIPPSDIVACLQTVAILQGFINKHEIEVSVQHPLISMCNTGKDRSVFTVMLLDIIKDITSKLPHDISYNNLEILLSEIDFYKLLEKEARVMSHECTSTAGIDTVRDTLLRNHKKDEFNRLFKEAFIANFKMLTGKKIEGKNPYSQYSVNEVPVKERIKQGVSTFDVPSMQNYKALIKEKQSESKNEVEEKQLKSGTITNLDGESFTNGNDNKATSTTAISDDSKVISSLSSSSTTSANNTLSSLTPSSSVIPNNLGASSASTDPFNVNGAPHGAVNGESNIDTEQLPPTQQPNINPGNRHQNTTFFGSVYYVASEVGNGVCYVGKSIKDICKSFFNLISSRISKDDRHDGNRER